MQAPISPGLLRMSQLQSRLTQVTDQSKTERDKLRKDIDITVKSIEDILQRNQQLDRNRFANIKDVFTQIFDGLSKQQITRDTLDQKSTNDILIFENGFVMNHQIEKQHLRDLEEKMFNMVSEKALEFKQMQQQENLYLFQNIDELKQEIATKLNDITQSMNEEKIENNKKLDEIELYMKQSCQHVKDLFAQERKDRLQGTDEAYASLTVMVNRMQAQMKDERDDREECEEQLIKLLDNTLSRMGK
ncbi:SF-assemblin [Hexamita inflata]|uniref:Putative n=1 Tax=Hexamita inflata TaxID=28002 RepID=A0AA86NVC5_9EUKA|nr:SF-assemblin [Hexamita inflata]